jgi:biopolymer transport protein ExbD
MKIPLPNPRRRARIEIIPLIDVVFFLLATFVMVSLSMVKNQGIPVNFPAASTSAPQSAKEAVTLSVTQEGEFYFNKEKISKEELGPRLAALKSSNPDTIVLINADEKAAFGSAIFLMDQVRQVGIRKVALRTQRKVSPEAPLR